jgi:hypothetical protein
VGISLDPAGIVFRDTLIDGVTEHVRWYARGPYFATAGRPMAVTGSLEDRAGVRLGAARIMNRVAALAQYSASRLRAEVELGAAPLPFPGFGQD